MQSRPAQVISGPLPHEPATELSENPINECIQLTIDFSNHFIAPNDLLLGRSEGGKSHWHNPAWQDYRWQIPRLNKMTKFISIYGQVVEVHFFSEAFWFGFEGEIYLPVPVLFFADLSFTRITNWSGILSPSETIVGLRDVNDDGLLDIVTEGDAGNLYAYTLTLASSELGASFMQSSVNLLSSSLTLSKFTEQGLLAVLLIVSFIIFPTISSSILTRFSLAHQCVLFRYKIHALYDRIAASTGQQGKSMGIPLGLACGLA